MLNLDMPAIQATVGAVVNKTTLHHAEQVVNHLASYVKHMSNTFPRAAIVKAEALLAMRKWTTFTTFSGSIPDNLVEADVAHLFLKEGLCASAVVQYLSLFFKTRSPLLSVACPVNADPLKESEISFYPINFQDACLEEKTQYLRFLQAAYRTASSSNFKKSNTLDYIPKKILKRQNLELVQRLPAKEKFAFPITDLLKIIKELENQNSQDTAYLLGLAGPQNHSLVVHVNKPYHFFDPRYGLALCSDKREEFMLFLVSYITEKYPSHQHFALLEFKQSRCEGGTSLQTPEGRSPVLPA